MTGDDPLNDDMDTWWTKERAATHLGVKPATIAAYIRDGLPEYFKRYGGFVDRDELLAEYRRRTTRKRGSRKLPRDSA